MVEEVVNRASAAGSKCQGRMKEIKDRASVKRDDSQKATAKEDLGQGGEEEPADQEEG